MNPFPHGALPDASYASCPATPDLYVAGNSMRGVGNSPGIDGRFLYCSGTAGHPAIVENNYFHHVVRFGHLIGCYVTFRKNIWGVAYHHGMTGSNLDDYYVTDIAWENNLFVCDRGNPTNTTTSSAIQASYNHRCIQNNITIANNTCDGWQGGLFDFSDVPDQYATNMLTNFVCVNNVIANGKYAFYRQSTATQMNHLHVIECDYNNVYNQATGFCGTGIGGTPLTGTKCTGFYKGSSKYNRLTGVGRNINGVALFDASYATVQTGRSLVYTVNTLGQDHTLTWGGGSPVQLVYDFGTSSGGGLRSLGCTGKSTWVANINSIKMKWCWIVSGTGAGQARAITWVTANAAISVSSVAAGGTGYAVGQYIQLNGGTQDTGGPNSATVLKVTSVSGGVITGLSIVHGGTYSTPPSNPVATQRITVHLRRAAP